MDQERLLPRLPIALRNELFAELSEMSNNFAGGAWRSTGWNAGRFCEIAYCVVKGEIDGAFPEKATKPAIFPDACRRLQNEGSLPKSVRFILLPLLMAMYEIRNTRDIGHVGSDVDPSFMDASFVVASVKWVVAEFVRLHHKLPMAHAQSLIDSISQYAVPYVWSDAAVRRVLRTGLSLDMKILLLLSAAGGRATRDELFDWLDESTRSTFNRRLATLHSGRLVEAKAFGSAIQILPPGLERLSSFEHEAAVLAA